MTWLVSAVHPKLPPPGSAQVSASSRLVLEKFRLTADGAHTRPRSGGSAATQLCLRLGSQRSKVGAAGGWVCTPRASRTSSRTSSLSQWPRRHGCGAPGAITPLYRQRRLSACV